MTAPIYESWRKRGTALSTVIDHQVSAMQDCQESVRRKETLIALLMALKAFGTSQLTFFLNGFDPAAKVIRLEPSTLYPPEYAMRTTIDQIAYDLDVIQRAYQQRLPSQSALEMRDLLAKADYLAYRALKPAIDRQLIDDVTVVTYFQKAINVRIIPYAPVAFIGLPLSALAVPSDLLAIPHEVGHYVFRHGCIQNGPAAGSRFDAALKQQLTDVPAWCLAWLEEIFADVYGALVGGPVMALGFEELVTDDPYADFIADDGEHPIAALRPNIYHTVLEKQGNHGRELRLLTDLWQEWQTKRGAPQQFIPHGETEAISMEKAEEQITQAIDSMWEDDLGGLKGDTSLWSGALRHREPIEKLLEYFGDKVEEMTIEEEKLAPELDVAPKAGTRDLDSPSEEILELHLRPLRTEPGSGPVPAHDMGGSAANRARRVGETGQWFDALKSSGATFNIPPEVWMALLNGSGWATEGPGGGANAH